MCDAAEMGSKLIINRIEVCKKTQKRKGMEQFQYQVLWDVLKVEIDRMKEFLTKYHEVKVETTRKKVTETL